ncbi:MAG TPA: hypothetical protein VMF89_06715, partial [Polyangiales bacterium]|nr:hypothetical protein [Polyangiales bacterium]
DRDRPPAPEEAGSAREADAGEPLPFVPLIDQQEWRNYESALDPLPEHQPDEIRCTIAGWFVERGALEVDTQQCNYVLVEHPVQRAVPEGSTVQLELVHFDLDAPEPATAHVALFFGADLQWQREIPIPSFAYVYKETFQATRALDEGEPIRLHLHNHGQNTWLLDSLYGQVP